MPILDSAFWLRCHTSKLAQPQEALIEVVGKGFKSAVHPATNRHARLSNESESPESFVNRACRFVAGHHESAASKTSNVYYFLVLTRKGNKHAADATTKRSLP